MDVQQPRGLRGRRDAAADGQGGLLDDRVGHRIGQRANPQESVHKGYRLEQAPRALKWAHEAGIKNTGYFIIGLPGETVETIKQTIALSKSLPLDMALFHVAAPYPGTPFFFEVLENNWFRPGTQWEAVDMDQVHRAGLSGPEGRRAAVLAKARVPRVGVPARPDLDVPQGHQWPSVVRSAVEVGLQTLSWVRG